MMEVDASIQGLGVIMYQPKPEGKMYPLAYASRLLSNQEEKLKC